MITADQILDYIAISEVKAAYCRRLDSKDWVGWGQLFTDDFELDTRPSGGSLTHGRDAAVEIVRSAIETAITAHQVHSPEMTIEGDVAQVVWAMQDRVAWPAEIAAQMGNAGITGYGHYHERYVKQDGHWLISSQKLTRLHMDILPLQDGS